MSLPHTYTIALTGASGLLASGVIRQALPAGHRIIALDRLAAPSSTTSASPSSLAGEDGSGGSAGGSDTPPNSEISPKDRALTLEAIKAHPGQYTYHQVDLLDHAAVKRVVQHEGCDAVVHLAAVYKGHDIDGVHETGGWGDHEIHNMNTAMSYNMLCIAAELGIDRVVLASSVNAIGMLFSRPPQFDYLPVDEDHPCRPEDPYSLSKQICELQATSIARTRPSMRIASMRFHWVLPTPLCSRSSIRAHRGSEKDLWGWVSVLAAGEAVLRGIISPLENFGVGHETFFVVASRACGEIRTTELLQGFYPETEWRGADLDNEGTAGAALISSEKAERLLGWVERDYPDEEPSGKEGVKSAVSAS